MQKNLDNMTPGFWRLARRERGAYPGSVTSEQRRQPPKEPVRLFKLFCIGDLILWLRPRRALSYSGRMVHVGVGYDVHALAQGRRLVLGGVEIPHGKGLEGHSDADVLMHAICDAILGALGEADLGHFFPNTDPRW